MVGDVVSNRVHKFIDGTEDSVTQPIFRDVTKEALDHIEPRSAGRSEVNVEAFVAFHPRFDLGMFVRGIVIANDVNFFVETCISLD